MKTKNIIPLLLTIISLLYSAPTYTVLGNISGPSLWEGPEPVPDVSHIDVNYYGTSVSGTVISDVDSLYLGNYGIEELEYCTDFTIRPEKEGYKFDPDSINHPVLSSDLSDQNFVAIDTMPTEITCIAPTDSTWVVNTTDILKFLLDDNCGWVAQYSFHYSSDGGNSYTLLEDVITSTFEEKLATEHNLKNSTKKWAFTPAEISDQYKIMFIAIDPDGNKDTAYSQIFAVIDTVKPTAKATAPNGAETWYISTIHNIEWTATDNYSIHSRVISLSTDNGSNWTELDSAAGNTLTWPWLVPNNPSTECLICIRVYDIYNNMQEDTSDAAFTIVEAPDTIDPAVSVTAPVTNESIQRGSDYNVTWTATDNKGVEKISIYLDIGSGYSKLDSMNSNPRTWSWSVPATEHLTSNIKIYAYDAAGNRGEGISGIFKIKNIDSISPTTTVLEPVKGAVFNAGHQRIGIKTISYDNFELTWISYYLSLDGGATYTLKDSIAHGDMGEKDWALQTDFPEAYDECKLKVIVYDAEGYSAIGYSDSLFKLADINEPGIEMAALPDTLQAGIVHKIEWGSYDWVGIHYTLLFLSTDSGATYTKLDSINPDTMSILWNVPQISAPQCFLVGQTFDAASLSSSDTSKVFTIELPTGISCTSSQKKYTLRIVQRSIILDTEGSLNIKIFNLRGQKIYDRELCAGKYPLPRIAQGICILQVNSKSLIRKFY